MNQVPVFLISGKHQNTRRRLSAIHKGQTGKWTSIPAVCHLSPYGCHLEECAFLGVGVCAFMDNFNSKESYGWVECTLYKKVSL
jgi:hypothetical protein